MPGKIVNRSPVSNCSRVPTHAYLKPAHTAKNPRGTHAMSRRRSYDVAFKLNAVECARKTSKEAVAREFGVATKSIRLWCSQKEELVALKKARKCRTKRMKGAGRKPRDQNMEEALFSWIVELRSRNLRVSRSMIRVQARALSTDDGFKASLGWLRRFLKRHSLSLRRKTTVCQSVPSNCIPKIVSFIIHLRTLQMRNKYQYDSIFATDETACWMDMPGDTTVATTGSRSVSLKTTGHEKNHFTVVLTARADGKKLKPFVVFKGKGTRLIKDLQSIPGIIVKFSANGWMNDALTAQYLHSIIGSLSFTKRLLIWDAYRCHTSEATRAEVLRMGLHTAIVPGGCTKFIQAADVVWNACFKGHLRSIYDSWLAEPAGHQYTRGGNMKPPPRSLLCEWVKSSWDAVPTEMVKNSFTSCAITTSVDGSDDHKIHCFKEGQPCEEGTSLLREKMEALVSGCSQDDDTDPFSSDTDDEETENNEICVDEDEDSDGDDDVEESTTSEDEAST